MKHLSVEQARTLNEQVAAQAETVGLTYRFDTMKYTNTYDAHRIAKYAGEQGKGKEFVERVFYAYFTASKLISDPQTLIELAREVDLDPIRVEQILQSDQYQQEIQHDIQTAAQMDVKGVPFFVFNEKYALSGAQPTELFLQTLRKVWKEAKQSQTSPLNNTAELE